MAVHDATPIEHRVLSVLVENRSGVLSHVVGLFSARGFNIASLAVGETEDPTMSRITLVAECDEKIFEQIKKQLNKLIDVIKVNDLHEEGFIDRELMLVKMKNTTSFKSFLTPMLHQYGIRVAEETPKFITIECVESRENTMKIFGMLKEIGILEMAQTGAVALSQKMKE